MASGGLPSSSYGNEACCKDYEEAIKWLQRAAEQGKPFASWDLGKMYRDGKMYERRSRLGHWTRYEPDLDTLHQALGGLARQSNHND